MNVPIRPIVLPGTGPHTGAVATGLPIVCDPAIADEISYASSARSVGGRLLIRTMENATGRRSLIRRAAGYETDLADGRDFWRAMLDRYGLRLNITSGTVENLPQSGPLIVVANHPFGILDGLMMGHILSAVRRDFRIVAHRIFAATQNLDRVVLPICFDKTKDAIQRNLDTRRDALRHLGQGGAVGIFPGGTVSTALHPFGRPMDPVWRKFTARLIARSGATVVPIHFDGANSRLFQMASHLNQTLRMAFLIREFRRRVDTTVDVVIGRPIPAGRLGALRDDPMAMMDFLRARTYALSPKPVPSLAHGFEFEDRYRD